MAEVYNEKENNHNDGYRNNNDRNWCIVYDRNDSYQKRSAEEICNSFNQFCGMRRFQRKPLNPPQILGLDYANLTSIRSEIRCGKFRVALFILPDRGEVGKLKVDITRHVLFALEPQSALSSPCNSPNSKYHDNDYKQQKQLNELEIDVQFMLQKTTRKRNAVFNVFES